MFTSILSCANQSVPSEVFEIYLEGKGLPIYCSMFWYQNGKFLIFLRFKDFYKTLFRLLSFLIDWDALLVFSLN